MFPFIFLILFFLCLFPPSLWYWSILSDYHLCSESNDIYILFPKCSSSCSIELRMFLFLWIVHSLYLSDLIFSNYSMIIKSTVLIHFVIIYHHISKYSISLFHSTVIINSLSIILYHRMTITRRVLLAVANGFEEIEMTAPLDILRRAGADVILVSVNPS